MKSLSQIRNCAFAFGAVASVVVVAQTTVDCSTFNSQSCEVPPNNSSCYWAFQLDSPACKPIPYPLQTSVCKCTKANGDCSDETGGHGCEPSRFCAYSSGCSVKPINGDSDCLIDGDSGKCAQSDYCYYKADGIPIDTDGDCLWNGRKQPKAPTRRPTVSPTPGSAAPVDTSKPTPQSTFPVVPVAGAAGGLVAVGVLVLAFCLMKGTKEPEVVLPELKGLQNIPTDILATPSSQSIGSLEIPIPRKGAGTELEVLYDFEGENGDELTVNEGTILVALGQIDNEWWEATAPNGTIGLIPTSYVKPLSGGVGSFSLLDEEKPDF